MKSDAKLFGFNTGRASIPATAQGRAKVEVIDHGTPLRFRVKLAGVNNLLMAHIHIAPDPVEITEPAGPIAYWFTGGPLPVTNLTEQVNGTLANGYVITDGQLEARDPADPATGTIAGLITAISEGSGVGRRSHGRSESGNIHRLPGDSRAGELRGTLQ